MSAERARCGPAVLREASETAPFLRDALTSSTASGVENSRTSSDELLQHSSSRSVASRRSCTSNLSSDADVATDAGGVTTHVEYNNNVIRAWVYTLLSFAVGMALVHITKWIYVVYHFNHALWLTVSHMVATYLMSVIVVTFFSDYFPKRRQLNFRESIFLVTPFSFLGAASIGCGNMALVHLYPSFHQMLQNTSPIWAVVCAMTFASKRFNDVAYMSLIPVCVGGALAAWGEPSQFEWIGVVLSIVSSVLRALRATLQGLLMQGQEKLDSIALIYYSSPVNVAIFLLASLVIEGSAPWVEILDVPMSGILWILLAACCAACFNLLGYLILGYMGAVGAMVVGNLKTPTSIVTSYLVFGNGITTIQVSGFVMAAVGTYIYSAHGHEVKMVEDAALATKDLVEKKRPLRVEEGVDTVERARLNLSTTSATAFSVVSSSGRALSLGGNSDADPLEVVIRDDATSEPEDAHVIGIRSVSTSTSSRGKRDAKKSSRHEKKTASSDDSTSVSGSGGSGTSGPGKQVTACESEDDIDSDDSVELRSSTSGNSSRSRSAGALSTSCYGALLHEETVALDEVEQDIGDSEAEDSSHFSTTAATIYKKNQDVALAIEFEVDEQHQHDQVLLAATTSSSEERSTSACSTSRDSSMEEGWTRTSTANHQRKSHGDLVSSDVAPGAATENKTFTTSPGSCEIESLARGNVAPTSKNSYQSAAGSQNRWGTRAKK
ncbi:unnamed protein product [Amoebophrya sp. A25]|nr:unnamed protein product [Amoebophrya sp. A25]|eukprot:GSA25T00004474001.1